MRRQTGTKCWVEFCWTCLALYKDIRVHGNEAHDPDCRHHSRNIGTWHAIGARIQDIPVRPPLLTAHRPWPRTPGEMAADGHLLLSRYRLDGHSPPRYPEPPANQLTRQPGYVCTCHGESDPGCSKADFNFDNLVFLHVQLLLNQQKLKILGTWPKE
jgi:hypothetical protein